MDRQTEGRTDRKTDTRTQFLNGGIKLYLALFKAAGYKKHIEHGRIPRAGNRGSGPPWKITNGFLRSSGTMDPMASQGRYVCPSVKYVDD